MSGHHYQTYEGNTFRLRVVAVNSDRTPMDLTGATMRADIAVRPGEPPVASFSVSADGAPSGGAVWLDVVAPARGSYAFDLRVVLASGEAITLLAGSTLDVQRVVTLPAVTA